MKKSQMESGDKPANQSVSKMIQLISFLAQSRSPLRLHEIAAGSGMPQATTLRYLNALMAEGFVFQDGLSGRYALTWKLCNLGDQVRRHFSLRSLSGDVVTWLSEQLGLGICLVIEQDMECMYLDCIYESAEMGATLLRIGKQTPLHAAGSGKVLLTQYDSAKLDELIARKGLAALTERTITDKAALVRELERVRNQGFALDDEECETGLRCVAVPIYGYGERVEAAISVFGAAQRLTDGSIRGKILPLLKEAAARISLRVGSSGGYDPDRIVQPGQR